MPKSIAFVTVGSTKFDALIRAIDEPDFADELVVQAFSKLVVQRGDGSYIPQRLLSKGDTAGRLSNGLQVEIFQYAPNLENYMREAELIISHAGAGSLFEAMRMGKPLIAVPNPILMGNHQAELAKNLEEMRHCFTAAPDNLLEVIQNYNPAKLIPYTAGDAKAIAKAIEDHMQSTK